MPDQRPLRSGASNGPAQCYGPSIPRPPNDSEGGQRGSVVDDLVSRHVATEQLTAPAADRFDTFGSDDSPENRANRRRIELALVSPLRPEARLIRVMAHCGKVVDVFA